MTHQPWLEKIIHPRRACHPIVGFSLNGEVKVLEIFLRYNGCISVNYCCITNHPKTWYLRITVIYLSRSCGSWESGWFPCWLPLGSFPSNIQLERQQGWKIQNGLTSSDTGWQPSAGLPWLFPVWVLILCEARPTSLPYALRAVFQQHKGGTAGPLGPALWNSHGFTSTTFF